MFERQQIRTRYANGWYNEGLQLLHRKEYDEAAEFFDNALKIIPEDPEYLIGRGDVLFATGQYTKAQECYCRVLEAAPNHFHAWMRAGSALLRIGENEAALDLFSDAKKLFAYDGELWLGYGIALLNLDRVKEATDALKKAMRLKPKQPALYYYLSRLERDNEEALKILIKGNHLDPLDLDILLEMTKRLISMGELERAAETLKKAEHADPHNILVKRMNQYYQVIRE